MENKNIDNVNNPNHYQLDCGIESIEIIKRVLGLRGFVAFCLGNILKYLYIFLEICIKIRKKYIKCLYKF